MRWLAAVIFSFLSTVADAAASMTELVSNEAYTARRYSHFFVVELKTPHQVFSTSSVNGGFSDSLRYLVNFQSMEANADMQHAHAVLSMGRHAYHERVATSAGLPAAQMAMMGTAANMHNLIHVRKTFGDLSVDAFVTAGVRGNALRAGDPTRWHETAEGNKKVDVDGTINTLLIINLPLTPGAQSKAVMLMVEAKSAALAQLRVPSTVSPYLATGTGTDQFIIASPLDRERHALESASGHLKLGELVGAAVLEATLEALRWQNRLENSDVADLLYVFSRFGLTEERMLRHLQTKLDTPTFERAKNNLSALRMDARFMAAAYAYAELLDRFQYQQLPDTLRAEVLLDQAAQLAVGLSGKSEQWIGFREQLNFNRKTEQAETSLLLDAMALGWVAKWK